MNDGELVRQATNGRPAAYGELAKRWSARVVAICHARTGRMAIAEELAQETLLRGFRSLKTIRSPERFGSWICGIAHRVCLDWHKSKQAGQIQLSTADGTDSSHQLMADQEDVDESVQNAEEHSQLTEELHRLPDDLREVLMLYYYENVTYQQLAEQLEVSAATVNSRLTRARKLLRQRLSRSGR